MASSLFSQSQNSTAPRFKILPARSIHESVSATEKRKVVRSCHTSVSGSSSEAATRRIRGKGARARAQRTKNDPRMERTIFIGNIPTSCNRKDIKKLLKDLGSIESIRLRSIKVTAGDRPFKVAKMTQKQLVEDSSFNAYVVFSSVDEAENCLTLNGAVHCGRHLRVDRVEKKATSPGGNQRSVFVGNLPFSADEEKLREVFSCCGDIEAVRVVRDSKSGVGKGFGFVMFEDTAGVMFAVRQTKKLEMDGRLLRVSRCRNQHGQDLSNTTRPKSKAQNKTKHVAVLKGKGNGVKQPSTSGVQRLVATKYLGKCRPDGTKNRLYRLPPSLSQ